MPLISIAELLSASIVALQGQGFSRELAAEIAEEFVVSELTGTKTHGVGKLGSLQFGDLAAKPDIVHCIPTQFVWRSEALSAYWRIRQGRRLSLRLGLLIR